MKRRRYAEGSIDRGFHVMLSKYRSLALCAVLVVPALVLSACGGDVPGNSVAKVGDQSIKKATFDHWMQIAAVSQAGQANPNSTSTPKAQIPDPPDFTKCVADKKAHRREAGQGPARADRRRSSRPSASSSYESSATRSIELPHPRPTG